MSVLRASRAAAAMACLSCCPVPSIGQESEPYRTRNLNPLVSIFGLPAWRRAGEQTVLSFTTELANHYRLSLRGDEKLVIDAETWRSSLYYSRPIGGDWTLSAELPVYQISGGVLDDVVDAWHSIFGLPDGGRNNREERAVAYELARGSDVFYGLFNDETGVGDVQLAVARRFGADGGFHVTASVKLPTGEEDMLAGSGSSDVALTVMRTREGSWRGRDAGFFWGIGVLSLGEAERIRFDQRERGYMGVIGGGFKVTRRLGLKAQIDMHSNLYDSPLEEIGERAFQATLGGWLEVRDGPVIDFGVNEDLEVSTSPDVVIHVNVRWRW